MVSRAFASLADTVSRCAHLCSESGCFLAMKGVVEEQELQAVKPLCELRGVHTLKVPGLNEARHLIGLGPVQRGN